MTPIRIFAALGSFFLVLLFWGKVEQNREIKDFFKLSESELKFKADQFKSFLMSYGIRESWRALRGQTQNEIVFLEKKQNLKVPNSVKLTVGQIKKYISIPGADVTLQFESSDYKKNQPTFYQNTYFTKEGRVLTSHVRLNEQARLISEKKFLQFRSFLSKGVSYFFSGFILSFIGALFFYMRLKKIKKANLLKLPPPFRIGQVKPKVQVIPIPPENKKEPEIIIAPEMAQSIERFNKERKLKNEALLNEIQTYEALLSHLYTSDTRIVIERLVQLAYRLLKTPVLFLKAFPEHKKLVYQTGIGIDPSRLSQSIQVSWTPEINQVLESAQLIPRFEKIDSFAQNIFQKTGQAHFEAWALCSQKQLFGVLIILQPSVDTLEGYEALTQAFHATHPYLQKTLRRFTI